MHWDTVSYKYCNVLLYSTVHLIFCAAYYYTANVSGYVYRTLPIICTVRSPTPAIAEAAAAAAEEVAVAVAVVNSQYVLYCVL